MKKVELLARQVLDDCYRAHQLIEDVVTEQDFRVHWVALVTLLRSVGQVLKEVDGLTDPDKKKKIDDLWALWSANKEENEIFWKFIKAERDFVLKEYSFGTHPGSPLITIEKGNDSDSYLIDECLFKPLTHGRYAREDGRDIARMAIDWWEKQLQTIER